MSWTIINFWLDACLMVVFLTNLWCAFVIRFIFPSPTNAGGWLLWGWSYTDWANAQFWGLCILAAGILVHVMLHWTWVCGVVAGQFAPRKDGRKRMWTDGERTLVGVGMMVTIIVIMGIAFAAANFSITHAG